jgi:hypothetical protein
LRVQKNVEELHEAKEECYNVATKCAKNLKNSFSKVGAFFLSRTLSAMILTGLSGGLMTKPKLLKRFSVTEEIFVPSLVPVGPCRSLKMSAANMPRL